MRLDTPFKLRTSEDTETLGGYSTSKCTWSASPLASTTVAPKSPATRSKCLVSRSIASASNTFLQYLVTKIKCTCNAACGIQSGKNCKLDTSGVHPSP